LLYYTRDTSTLDINVLSLNSILSGKAKGAAIYMVNLKIKKNH